MTSRIERGLAVQAAGIMVALGMVVFLTFTSSRDAQHSLLLVTDTRERLEEIEQILRLMVDAHSATRGFVITAQESLLEPYRAARAQAEDRMQRLETHVFDTPGQLERLGALRRLVASHFEWRERLIRVRRQDGLEAAQQLVARGDGESVMDAIRALTAEMKAEEERLLRERQQAAAADARWNRQVLTVVAIVIFVVVGASFLFVRRHVAARVEAEEESRQLAEQLEAERVHRRVAVMLEAVDLGIFVLDLEGKTTFANPAAERLLGYSAPEMIGRQQHALIHHSRADGTVYPREECPIYAAFRDGRSHRVSGEVFWRKDGSSFPVDYVSNPIRGPEGEVTGAVVAFDDITERRRAEEALRISEERFAKAFRNSPDAIVITRLEDGLILEVNDAVHALVGISRDEMVGRTSLDLGLFSNPGDRDEMVRRLKQAGFVRNFELDIRRPSGEVRHVSLSTELMEIGGKRAMLTLVRDVTEIKQAQDALRTLNLELERRVEQRTQALEEANRELEAFSYSVSHDLRAPLRHIGGYVELLTRSLDGQLPEKSRRYLATIADASQEMSRLIDDLLSFSRMGRSEMRQESVDLNALVRECLGSMESILRERRIDWTIPALPQVSGDRAMLKQVFGNLLENAVKYTRPRDPARIEIGYADDDGGHLVLFVRDNGVGFDPRYAAKLFGVFQRLHRPEDFEGTGIGLANVRRIVTRHGGRTWAEGALDRGAAVYFTLPRTDGPPDSGERHA